MTDRLAHRGPDAGGSWLDVGRGIALGHRRLSIIDLSQAGAQPMVSANGRWVLTYNGEIYNHLEVRARLESAGYPFRGHADTEVLLAAIQEWGVPRALESVQGMFAFAVWDREARELVLARDRVGKKPLYYGWCNGQFLFASELKALRCHPAFDPTVHRAALGEFLRYGWISEPLSIYARLAKLMPGAMLRVSAGTPGAVSVTRYWHARERFAQARANPFSGGYEKAVDTLDRHLTESVQARMVADVDLGAFLSGGIDSSTVVGIMQRHSTRPVKTFSIGFEEKKYNEAEYAAAVAAHLGTEHHSLTVSPADCLAVVDRLTDIYDEPFGDSSQVPTYLLAEMAVREVKVALTGDGGDETFAGYKHYAEGLEQLRRLSALPLALRRTAAELAEGTSTVAWRLSRPHREVLKLPGWRRFGSKFGHKTRGWRADGPQSLLAQHFARLFHPERLVRDWVSVPNVMNDADEWLDGADALSAMRHFDYVGYMVGDVLVKVDRATMAVGLEARCPLLDTRIAEFAWSLPNAFMLDGGGKRILKSLLERYVPRACFDRPKRGFGVPVADWLRGPLRDWAEDLLSPARLAHGTLHAGAVRTLWQQHISGWRDNSRVLWSLLMFQAWLANGQSAPSQPGTRTIPMP